MRLWRAACCRTSRSLKRRDFRGSWSAKNRFGTAGNQGRRIGEPGLGDPWGGRAGNARDTDTPKECLFLESHTRSRLAQRDLVCAVVPRGNPGRTKGTPIEQSEPSDSSARENGPPGATPGCARIPPGNGMRARGVPTRGSEEGTANPTSLLGGTAYCDLGEPRGVWARRGQRVFIGISI